MSHQPQHGDRVHPSARPADPGMNGAQPGPPPAAGEGIRAVPVDVLGLDPFRRGVINRLDRIANTVQLIAMGLITLGAFLIAALRTFAKGLPK